MVPACRPVSDAPAEAVVTSTLAALGVRVNETRVGTEPVTVVVMLPDWITTELGSVVEKDTVVGVAGAF